MKKYSGYLPPADFNFATSDEALANFSAAVCAAEFSRYQALLKERLFKCKSEDLQRFIPAYLLIDLAAGKTYVGSFSGRESGAELGIKAWANAMLDFAAFFRASGIKDPLSEIIARGLVFSSGVDSYEPNISKIKSLLQAS